MERQSILDKLREIIASSVAQPGLVLTEQTSQSDIEGWHSLENAMIITAIEEEYHCRFKLTELLSWKTMGDLIDLIISKQE